MKAGARIPWIILEDGYWNSDLLLLTGSAIRNPASPVFRKPAGIVKPDNAPVRREIEIGSALNVSSGCNKFLRVIASCVFYGNGARRSRPGVLPGRAAHDSAEGLPEGAVGLIAE